LSQTFHGNFFIEGEFRERYVTIENGRISGISVEPPQQDIRRVEGHILPGGVDIHVHFRDPGEIHKEDFSSGSTSAIFGGTTTVFDMPNNTAPIIDKISFDNKLQSIGGKSFVDFGLYQAASGEIVEEAIGEKVFLGKSTGGLLTDIEKASFSGKIVVAHAESQECLESYSRKERNLQEHDLARPVECELRAIEMLFNSGIGNLHLAHLTSIQTVELGKKLGFSTEVTPHHILLNTESKLGAFGKTNPPLRKKSIQEELLNNLGNLNPDIVASDHAPHSVKEKEDFESASSGVPGVETRIPLLLMLVNRNVLSLAKAVSMFSTRPANRMGIAKGYIAKGFDADFSVFNLKEESMISADDLHSKCGWSPFEGFTGIFPKEVYLRGVLTMSEGEMDSQPKGVFIGGERKGKTSH
jgi:dihydroorotase